MYSNCVTHWAHLQSRTASSLAQWQRLLAVSKWRGSLRMVYFLHCFGCCFLPVRAGYNSPLRRHFCSRPLHPLSPLGRETFFVGTERAHSAAGTHPYPGPRIIVFVAVSGGHVLSARIVTGIVAGVLVGINFYSYYFSWMALGLGLSTWLGVAAFLRRWKDVKTLCIIGLTAVITGAPFLSLPLWDCNPK